jgi:hypothetical protein
MEFTTEKATRTYKSGRSFEVLEVTFKPEHVGDMFLIVDGEWYRACRRCSGYGHYSYMRDYGTHCFDCVGGSVGAKTTEQEAAKLMKTRIATRDRNERKLFLAAWEQAIQWDAFLTENADVVAYLADKEERRGFIGDMARKVAILETLSPRMLEVVRKCAAEDIAKSAKANEAGHFGEVGGRYEITATVTNVKECFSDFGITYLITMRGSEGHTFKTFASGAFADVEKNTTVTFKGTVKGHGEWNGMKETTLTRCMIPKAKKA